MSVYTPVSTTELAQFLGDYPVGECTALVGIQAGIENSNFFVSTTKGEYVLTLFEQHQPETLHYFLTLLQHWAAHDIPVPTPLVNQHGEILGTLNTKPAALVMRLPGLHPQQTNTGQCAAIGTMLARMHLATRDFNMQRASDRDHAWRMQMAQTVLPHLNAEDAELLQAEVKFQQSIDFNTLPHGTIHADLFRDNVLFDGETLSGVLDVYFACNDCLLYDLAVVVNDWCCHPDGSLDETRVQACIKHYQALRPWKPQEQQAWPALLRTAALRFWLSRLYEKYSPRPGELTLQKNPLEFRQKLQHRINAMIATSIQINARRLLCPLPVIRVQQTIENLTPGTVVTAVCTDPGALHDIPAWARIHGHHVLETRTEGREYTIVLKTGASP
ncbi:homoserine kinase [Candidatus Thiothrix anitrata]|uniref:Homoserine kinase n=1 Tax=Candidatus Thiothrix anitrata TaxID=2823902 RepID=A0ABX7X479_9GAMM|nr:homoserine kinase [Candidatus Thiothrix anitrata]QTR50675.1 homoserine kinase [Candidatus Thiothrix anitrata]